MESTANQYFSSSSSCYYGSGTSYPLLNTDGFHFIDSQITPQDFTIHWSRADESQITAHFSEPYHPETVADGGDTSRRKLLLKPYQQILPDINNRMIAESPGSFDHMNLDSLDLLASSRFSRIFYNDSSQVQTGISGHGFPYAFNYLPPSLSSTLPKVSESTNEVAIEPLKKSQSFKKHRLETRSCCPPLKVRKEKLGDRIAALQQLVSPFGKTDTASVLMEAIGYIKFLQNQVETLSVPYMKESRTKSIKTIEKNVEAKNDLKSRGLCLVPVSCLSYIPDGSGAVWPPMYYGGS